jgi:hypothetical protein
LVISGYFSPQCPHQIGETDLTSPAGIEPLRQVSDPKPAAQLNQSSVSTSANAVSGVLRHQRL